MSEFDPTPTEPPNQPGNQPSVDPSVDDVPREPDEGDIERGSADGSARANEVLEQTLDDAGAATGVETDPDGSGDPGR